MSSAPRAPRARSPTSRDSSGARSSTGERVDVLGGAVCLRPRGTFLACFYPLRDGDDGPPFPVSRDGIERVLAPHFRIVESGPPARSAERRQGLEWLGPAGGPDWGPPPPRRGRRGNTPC